jgi:hypothetical protein
MAVIAPVSNLAEPAVRDPKNPKTVVLLACVMLACVLACKTLVPEPPRAGRQCGQ